MPDYSKGKIYVIRNYINDKEYVGSTVETLPQRYSKHGTSNKEANCALWKAMKELGRENFYIELIENYPCNSKQELNAREGYWIRQKDTYKNGYNINIAGRTVEEWRKENRDNILTKKREYHFKNREQMLLKQREYCKNAYATDKHKVLQRCEKYRNNNRDLIRERSRQKYELNKEKELARFKVKVTCECGKEVNKYNLRNHQKSQQHLIHINKTVVVAPPKQRREHNKIYMKEYLKQYRKKNKDVIKVKRSELVTCECGKEVSRNHLARHRKSQKHITSSSV
jgi:hypothetical protein